MADVTITDLPPASGIDAAADWFAIDRTSLNTTQRINRNTMLGITGSPVGTTDSQTLTNKVITTPTLTVLDNALTIQDNSDPTKQAQFQLSGITAGQTRTLTVPNASTTIVGTDATQTLTNKTLTAPTITNGSITGTTITTDAIVGQTAATNGTVYGLQITAGEINGTDIQNATIATAQLADSSATPAKLLTGTGTSWPWSTWTPTWANFTVGNGTVTAAYKQTGKTVTGRLRVVLGNTSAMGTSPTFTLPVTAVATFTGDNYILGTGQILDSGTSRYSLSVYSSTTTIASMYAPISSGTYLVPAGGITSTAPMTWTTNDEFSVVFTYEAA